MINNVVSFQEREEKTDGEERMRTKQKNASWFSRRMDKVYELEFVIKESYNMLPQLYKTHWQLILFTFSQYNEISQYIHQFEVVLKK